MIAVVTGSTGFLGSHLTEALVALGAEVRVLLRPETKMVPGTGVRRYIADVRNSNALSKSAIWDEATHVFHLGGRTRAGSAMQFVAANVVPTQNILEAVIQRNSSPHFVFVSSLAAAGPAESMDAPLTEENHPHPIEAYGASKLEAERVVMSAHCVPWTIIRPAAVYGPRDHDFPRAFRQAERRLGFFPTPYQQQFSVVHVDDVVRALIAVATPPCTGRTYYVANRQPLTWEEVYRLIRQVSGRSGIALHAPALALRIAGKVGDLAGRINPGFSPMVTSAKVKLALARYWLCDASRLRADTGWNERVTVQQGLSETYLSWRSM